MCELAKCYLIGIVTRRHLGNLPTEEVHQMRFWCKFSHATYLDTMSPLNDITSRKLRKQTQIATVQIDIVFQKLDSWPRDTKDTPKTIQNMQHPIISTKCRPHRSDIQKAWAPGQLLNTKSQIGSQHLQKIMLEIVKILYLWDIVSYNVLVSLYIPPELEDVLCQFHLCFPFVTCRTHWS